MISVINNKNKLRCVGKEYNTKKEFVVFIKHMINEELENEKIFLNRKRNYLYTKVDPNKATFIFSYLYRIGCTWETHLNNYYWIKFK